MAKKAAPRKSLERAELKREFPSMDGGERAGSPEKSERRERKVQDNPYSEGGMKK